MAITLTEAAAKRVQSQIQARGFSEALKLGVKTSGCSGFAYILDYAKELTEGDQVYESNGVKLIVNDEHLNFLKGTEIDYVEDGLSAAFHFNNPNVTEQCGCGESFTVN
jgi:iron-sulfur cluster assembly protein